MMPIYRALLIDGEFGQNLIGETGIEQDRAPIKTALVDQYGVPIYRLSPAIPMGFKPSKRTK